MGQHYEASQGGGSLVGIKNSVIIYVLYDIFAAGHLRIALRCLTSIFGRDKFRCSTPEMRRPSTCSTQVTHG